MDALDGPRTAEEIAEAAGLDRRYVTEWLGIMACGGIVEVSRGDSGKGECFRLPPEHGDFLCRRAGENNLGVYTQEIPLLTHLVMDHVVEGFSSGRGIPYRHYPAFQQFMGELADAKHTSVLIQRFLPSVEDGALVADLEAGIDVCDLGCGRGKAVLLMAAAYPQSRFTGIDLDREAVDQAARTAASEGLGNALFQCLDAAAIERDPGMESRFDYITAFDAIHDQTRPLAALRGARHMLRPCGRFSMIDIAAHSEIAGNLDHPMGAFLYTVSLMHCMPVGLAGGGRGLGMMWGRKRAVDLLEQAGFAQVSVEAIPDDTFNDHYLCR
jgi:SAM-dependent methyltransferase